MATISPFLPEELLDAICEQCPRETLANFARSSKQFYDIAIPHLYRDLSLSESRYDDAEPRDYLHLRELTMLFIRKPELARYVRTFSTRPSGILLASSKPFGRSRTENRPLEVEIIEAIQRLSHNEKEEKSWIDDISRSDDAIMAVLISLLPRLECIDLDPSDDSTRTKRILERIGRGERPFDSRPDALRNLHTAFWSTGHFRNSNCDPFLGLLQISSLRTLYIYQIHRHYQAVSQNPTVPNLTLQDEEIGFANIETIHVTFGCLTRRDTLRILAAPRALKEFTFDIGLVGNFSLPVLRTALEYQLNSLEYLCLEHRPSLWKQTDDIPPMESLRRFTSLRYLRITAEFIFGRLGSLTRATLESIDDTFQKQALYNLLPPQLEVLQIPDCQWETEHHIFESLDHLFTKKEKNSDILPHLREITIEDVYKKAVWRHFDKIYDLQKQAQAVGTELTIIWDQYFKRHDGHPKHVPYIEKGLGWNRDVSWRGWPVGAGHEETLATRVMFVLTTRGRKKVRKIVIPRYPQSVDFAAIRARNWR